MNEHVAANKIVDVVAVALTHRQNDAANVMCWKVVAVVVVVLAKVVVMPYVGVAVVALLVLMVVCGGGCGCGDVLGSDICSIGGGDGPPPSRPL